MVINHVIQAVLALGCAGLLLQVGSCDHSWDSLHLPAQLSKPVVLVCCLPIMPCCRAMTLLLVSVVCGCLVVRSSASPSRVRC